jgi:L-ribulose-5-phosphate 4-epimerase
MLEDLKENVLQANLELVRHGLVILNFGNVSGIDRTTGLMAIKPSGVSYEGMTAEDIVLVDPDGRPVESRLQPSSDTPTHLALYKAFPEIGGIAHAHSVEATAFAQARLEIRCLGTTHADHFNGPIPITRFLTAKEVEAGYELHTGTVIVDRFAGLRPLEMPAVLVAGHGPFTWGRTPIEAVQHALLLENVAAMARSTLQIDPRVRPLPAHILRKHHLRKHGPQAYYGQKKEPS